MRTKKIRSIACASITGIFGLVAPANATLPAGKIIGIDFGSVAPNVATNFNNYSDVTIANNATESFADLAIGDLIDTTGTSVSGVGFSVTNKTGQDTNPLVAGGGIEGFGLMSDSTIYGDILISNDANLRRITDGDAVIDGSGDRAHFVFTFSGLDNSLTYNLTGGFDNNGANNNFAAIWQANGQTFTTSPIGAGSGYGSLTGLSTDGSGNLVINVIRPGNTDGQHVTVSGLYLTAVGKRPVLIIANAANGSDLDFSWVSEAGLVYDLRSSTTLDTNPATWPVVSGQADIAPSVPNATLTIPRPVEPKTFYVLVPKAAP